MLKTSMLLYNVTVGMDKAIEREWIDWVKEFYIPAVIETGYFQNAKLYRVVTHDDEHSVSYSLQFLQIRLKTY